MKRKLMSVVIALLPALMVFVIVASSSTPAHATASVDVSARATNASTLLLNDDFDYGTTAMSLTTASGGNWVNHSGASPYVGYTTTSLSMVGYGSSGVGGAATILTTGSEDVNRSFITQTSGTVYFAALVNVSTAAVTGTYFLHLKDAGISNFRAKVFAKNDVGVLRFGLDTSASTGVYATGAYSYNTTYLLVTKLNLNTGATALYVLDTFSASEPATPVVSFTTGTTITVRSVAIRQSTSTASATPSATIDGVRVANTWADVVGASPEADLGVAKSGPATALAGDTFTYTISLSNTGTTTATGTLITDTLPAEVTFVTYTTALPGSFTQNGQALIWTVGDVPTTTTNATIGVQVTISPALGSGVSFNNTVTASTTYTESNQANNTASVTTFVGAPDLAIVKTGPASVNAGDIFAYTLTYSNAGTINATNVVIVDRLPAGMSYTGDSAGGVNFGNTITWTIGGLNASAGNSILLTATARYAGDWPNGATISGGPIDSNLANNTSTVTTTVNGADPYVLKSGPAIVFGGELVTYTLTYGNFGNVTATATLTDQLPSGFSVSNIAFDNSGLPFANGAAARTWTVNINPNSEFSFTLALTVPASITSGTRITNTLNISALESGDDPIDSTAKTSGTVYQIVPIATARAGSNGQVFAVEGKVTVVPATYSAGEWELQDATGGITAFYSPAPVVALGDRVRLVGTYDNSFGAQPELSSPIYFANFGPGSPVSPIPHPSGDVPAGTSLGWLTTISGTLSGLSTCSGNYHIFVNDGSGAADIFINAYSNPAINPCARGFANGDWVRITGFSTIFSPTYELRPRMASDLVQYPRVLSTGPASGATGVPVTANITATFNMTMTNVSTATFTLAGPTGPVTGIVSYTAGTNTATFDPVLNLAYSSRYTATLSANLIASNGLALTNAYVWSFTTEASPSDLSTSTKVASATGRIRAGDLVTYTISLINTGGTLVNVQVVDVLGSYYTVASALDFTETPTGTVSWLGVVPANQTVTLRFVVRVKSLTQLPFGVTVLNNTATVDDGINPTLNLISANAPTIQVLGIYLPLIRR